MKNNDEEMESRPCRAREVSFNLTPVAEKPSRRYRKGSKYDPILDAFVAGDANLVEVSLAGKEANYRARAQVAESGILGLSWLPQKNQKKIVAAEKMINDILEKFLKLKLVRAKSPAHRFDLFYEKVGSGRWAVRVWFSGRTIDIHVPIRTGKKTTVESNVVTEAVFSKKEAGKIISGVGRYLKARGWTS